MFAYRNVRRIVAVGMAVLICALADVPGHWALLVALATGFGTAVVLDYVKACPDERTDS